jgi:hypothetical protein
MNNSKVINFLDSKWRWLAIFGFTFLAAFYWLPESVPLFYSQVLPEEKLGNKYELLIIPVFIFVFFSLTELWLQRLALKNENMLNLIKLFRISLASFSYLIFIRIIILII